MEWAGYMSGAIESGLRAAHEVLKELGKDVDDENLVWEGG